MIGCGRQNEESSRTPDAGSVLFMTTRLNYVAASPRGMQAFGAVHLYLEKSGLPSALINLVYLRVSQINGCAYCISTHARDLMKEGVVAQKLLLLEVWR